MSLSRAILACAVLLSSTTTLAFTVSQTQPTHRSDTSLYAVPALVKKAKQAELQKYVKEGVEDHVMAKYNVLKEKLDQVDLQDQTPGPLQQALTKRKGTIAIVAEYKRKNSATESGVIKDIFAAELMSPVFREYGAAGIAVMADERMGGCSYDDLKLFVEEQRRAQAEVPGPVPIINNDLIMDELQVARTAAYDCAACVINLPIVGEEQAELLLKSCKALDLEAIVAVSSKEDAQKAIDLGARMLSFIQLPGADAKVEAIDGLVIPDGQQVCLIANILAKKDKNLSEVEEAWAVRDQGFNCVWVGEALYKPGLDSIDASGTMIKSMRSKSSLKFASPRAYTGKGEGAREYLGDIMM